MLFHASLLQTFVGMLLKNQRIANIAKMLIAATRRGCVTACHCLCSWRHRKVSQPLPASLFLWPLRPWRSSHCQFQRLEETVAPELWNLKRLECSTAAQLCIFTYSTSSHGKLQVVQHTGNKMNGINFRTKALWCHPFDLDRGRPPVWSCHFLSLQSAPSFGVSGPQKLRAFWAFCFGFWSAKTHHLDISRLDAASFPKQMRTGQWSNAEGKTEKCRPWDKISMTPGYGQVRSPQLSNIAGNLHFVYEGFRFITYCQVISSLCNFLHG